MSFAINQANNKPIPSQSQNGKKKTRIQNQKFLKKGFRMPKTFLSSVAELK